jgi:Tfp pilus assembly protein PilE
MKIRWAPAFTVVELLVIITIIGVLATVAIVGYNGVQNSTRVRAAQSDLTRVASHMQQTYQKTGAYPASLPSEVIASNAVELRVVRAGSAVVYSNLSAVQNGVLLAQICSDLIDEGAGRGTADNGSVNNYIIGCGNWNRTSTQITAWETRQWNTPVQKEQLTSYAANYTVSNSIHKRAQEATVKNFYTQLVTRMEAQGGTFPVTSFWDYWAAPGNGGVPKESIDGNGQQQSFYCAQASTNGGDDIWHTDQSGRVKEGAC